MSRIGKKPIVIPAGVEVAVSGRRVAIKGPKGELARVFSSEATIAKENNELTVKTDSSAKAVRSLWGTVRMHLANMVEGVTKGFTRQLQIEGIGYRAAVEGQDLVLHIGFTHPVSVKAENGVTFKVEKNIVTVSGPDKELISKVAAQIRRVRPPEPYKGKGIRYVGEKIRKKEGKKAAAGAAGGK